MPKLSLRGKLWNWTGFRNREDQLLILLSLVIGVIVGLTVVAFILLTGRLAARMYPPESAAWTYVGFEARDLKPGGRHAAETGKTEICIVVLSGKARVTATDFDSGVIGERVNVFNFCLKL